jgi:hypothetical protein
MAGTSSRIHLGTASAFWPAFNDRMAVPVTGANTSLRRWSQRVAA